MSASQTYRRTKERFYLWRQRVSWPIRRVVLRWMAQSGWASTLYYALGSSAFRREHRAVLTGKLRYLDEHASGASAPFLLRRNIHRIEKGLIMRPRRAVFATRYIAETTACYHYLADAGGDSAPAEEMVWARDVLTSYFEATGTHPIIDAARAQFEAATISRLAPAEADAPARPLAPYHRDLDHAPVSYESLHALARQRRSVRWYRQERVPRDLIDKALVVAGQAPSACNRQPFKFLIFDEPERAHAVASLPMGTVGFSDNIPAVAVLVGDLSAYFDERDRHVIYIDASLAAMSFLLALETLGLSSCCINWPDIEARETKIQRELGLRDDERVIMLIAMGYPDAEGMVPYSQKKPLSQARSYEA